ncbi:MAG: HAD family hydrolase [Deltaproteobacteria bacterium]|nr:HAD family hydrolase [Deltaproteobacteria bacterium]
MRHTAVLFDLDGTLLNTLEDLCDSLNRVLYKMGFPVHDLDQYRYFVGEGAGVLVERALPEDKKSPEIMSDCLTAFKDDYGKNWGVKTRVYPGIADLLDELAKKGLKMSVLSNKPHVYTLKCVEKYLGKWKFEVVFGKRENYPRKPDPFSALEIAGIMSEKPADFLYLGDTPIDMKTASNAGMYGIGVSWGFRPESELLESGAKRVIKAPLDLLQSL